MPLSSRNQGTQTFDDESKMRGEIKGEKSGDANGTRIFDDETKDSRPLRPLWKNPVPFGRTSTPFPPRPVFLRQERFRHVPDTFFRSPLQFPLSLYTCRLKCRAAREGEGPLLRSPRRDSVTSAMARMEPSRWTDKKGRLTSPGSPEFKMLKYEGRIPKLRSTVLSIARIDRFPQIRKGDKYIFFASYGEKRS